MSRNITLAFLALAVTLLMPGVGAVPVSGEAGPYRVELRTEPPVVTVGRAQILFRVTDAGGKPVSGMTARVLAKMPEMDMGEREAAAEPVAGQAGWYRAPAAFAMEGGYTVRLTLDGPSGPATATLALRTGRDTGGEVRSDGVSALLWVLGGVALLFVVYRMRRAGETPRLRALLHPHTLVGLLLLAVTATAYTYVVRTYRRPNSMTLVDALASDMSKMPAPPGAGPVVLATVERAPVRATVRYTGSAVGYVEQDITPRVTGWIVWMPLYAGDRVRKGQLLARLDTREYQSRVDERRANREMAEQMAAITGLEYQQALATAAQARAEVRSKEGGLEEARRMHARARASSKESRAGLTEAQSDLRSMQAMLTAARQERSEAEAMAQSAEATGPEAEAMLAAMQADQAYWQKEIARMKVLVAQGAVSGEDYQREEAMAKGSDAKVRQAEAKLQAVQSDIRAVRSKLARAEAMVESAEAKIAQAGSRIQGMEAKVEQAQAEIGALAGRVRMAEGDLDAARANARAMQAMAGAGAGKIRQAQAGVQSARAALTTASVVRGYTEIRSLIDGVVTQRTISPGVLVSPGQAILKVAQIHPIRLQANVAEADLSRIRMGTPVTIQSRDGASRAAARVTTLAPAVDPVTRTGVVETVVPNRDGRFLPGQYLELEIEMGSRRDGLRVPTVAVQWQSAASSRILATRQSAYVWVAEPAGDGKSYTVRRADIRTGEGDGRFSAVLGGLRPGQKVVAYGHDSLRTGDTVTAVPWSDEGPSALPEAGVRSGAEGHAGHGGSAGKAPAPDPGAHAGHGGR